MKYSQSQLILDSLRSPIESYLLTDAVTVNDSENVLDIGCGSGILALTLAVKYPFLNQIVGIDLVWDHISSAQLKHGELSRVRSDLVQCEWVYGDVRSVPFQSKSFDVIVSNPPFYPTKHGKHSPDLAKAKAHMDGLLTPGALLKIVNHLLKTNGRFYVVYPKVRLEEVKQSCRSNGLCIVKQMDYLDVRKRSGGITILTLQRESESN